MGKSCINGGLPFAMVDYRKVYKLGLKQKKWRSKLINTKETVCCSPTNLEKWPMAAYFWTIGIEPEKKQDLNDKSGDTALQKWCEITKNSGPITALDSTSWWCPSESWMKGPLDHGSFTTNWVPVVPVSHRFPIIVLGICQRFLDIFFCMLRMMKLDPNSLCKDLLERRWGLGLISSVVNDLVSRSRHLVFRCFRW
jgi:hypothetical protein